VFANVVHAVSGFPKTEAHGSTKINTREGALSRVDGGRANDFDAMSRIVSDAVNDEKSAPQTVIRILPTRPEG
jgi:hypothetical protein